MEIDFSNMNSNELEVFIDKKFQRMSSHDQYALLENEDFIRALFSSKGHAFSNLSLLYDQDYKLLEKTFSIKNIKILKSIDRDTLLDNLYLIEETTKTCDYMLTNENLSFLYDDCSFIINMLYVGKSSSSAHYIFFNNNLENEHLDKIYEYFKLDKITSKEIDLLVKIKERIGNPEEFYANLPYSSLINLINQ